MKTKTWIAVIAGVACGIALVVACNHAGMPASASPSDCAVWQFAEAPTNAWTEVPYTNPKTGETTMVIAYELADGWEPFTDIGTATFYMRRCKP